MSTMNRVLGLQPPTAAGTSTDAMSWAEKWVGATCTTTDPELWFSDYIDDRRTAVKHCRECPLKLECAELGAKERFGIWGGVDHTETHRPIELAS